MKYAMEAANSRMNIFIGNGQINDELEPNLNLSFVVYPIVGRSMV